MAIARSDSRAVLHPDGADLLETLLGQVAALSEQVHPTALEVLKLKEVYLGGNASEMQQNYSKSFSLRMRRPSTELPSDCAAPWRSGCQCCPEHLSGT